MARFTPHAAALLLAATAACSSEPDVMTIEITTGHEQDAFSREPAITRIDVVARSPEGDIVLSARTAPGGSFELGEVPFDRLLQFEVTGYDAEGTLRVRGRSLGVLVSGLVESTLPIFAQRIGEWARPPAAVGHSRVGPKAGVLAERYLMLVGGDAPSAQAEPGASAPAYYDLLSLSGSTGSVLPRSPGSMVMGADGVSVLVLDDQAASWVDFDLNVVTEAQVPEGLTSFGQVADGRTVAGADGRSYVVGATRLDEPSDAILVVEPDRSLAAAKLAFERRGAAAGFVDGLGLVVAGGSDSAPGLEVLPPDASTAVARPYPADPATGAAVLARGTAQHVLLLGGSDGAAAPPIRQLDALCTGDCTAERLDIDPPPALSGCVAFTTGTDVAILVGDDPTAQRRTRSFVVDLVVQLVTELALREDRAGATALATPTGMLAVVGGQHLDGRPALTVEMLAPE